MEHLEGSYQVEPGDGPIRDSYLKEHGVVTYLVVNPKVSRQTRPLLTSAYLSVCVGRHVRHVASSLAA